MKNMLQLFYGLFAIVTTIASLVIVVIVVLKEEYGYTTTDCYLFGNSYTRCVICMFVYMIFTSVMLYLYKSVDNNNQEED